MTEVDAGEVAREDAARLHKHLTAGAMPQQISQAMTKLIVRRVHDMASPRASHAIDTSARETPAPASTFSEHIVQHSKHLLTSAMRFLPPEDSRALLLWLIGPEPNHGVLIAIIQMINETSGPPAVQAFQQEAGQIMDKMKRMDSQLFGERLSSLNDARRNVINGMLLDAQWAARESDGLTARNHIVRARRLALEWLEQREQRQRLGWT